MVWFWGEPEEPRASSSFASWQVAQAGQQQVAKQSFPQVSFRLYWRRRSPRNPECQIHWHGKQKQVSKQASRHPSPLSFSTLFPLLQTNMSGEEWQVGLFDCCYSPGTCCFTCFCYPWQYGKNVEKLKGEGCLSSCLIACLCAPCHCICHSGFRGDLRRQYNLKETCGNDCLATCCCPACATCQEANELEARGSSGSPQNQTMS